MREQNYKRLKPTVATHFPSLSYSSDINQNVHMLTEDIHLAIMPIGGRTEKHNEFTVVLEGDEDQCQKAQHLLEELGEFDRYDLVEVVCDAVEKVARHLAWEGCAVYELISDDDGVQRIMSFTSKGLWKLPHRYLQIIPRGDWDLWKKKWVFIPATKIWYLGMPPILGGQRGYRRILRQLKRAECLGPEFWRKDLEYGGQSQNFDFQRYVRNCEIYVGQITRSWGWNRRDWSQERSTEFFSFYKMVNFRWAQAVLREHIIEEFNRLFGRLGIACEVKVSGLPTPQDILNTKSEMLAGRITFGAASDQVML